MSKFIGGCEIDSAKHVNQIGSTLTLQCPLCGSNHLSTTMMPVERYVGTLAVPLNCKSCNNTTHLLLSSNKAKTRLHLTVSGDGAELEG